MIMAVNLHKMPIQETPCLLHFYEPFMGVDFLLSLSLILGKEKQQQATWWWCGTTCLVCECVMSVVREDRKAGKCSRKLNEEERERKEKDEKKKKAFREYI